MAPHPKPIGEKADKRRRNSRGGQVNPVDVRALPSVAPDAPAGLLKQERADWVEFWEPDVASIVDLAADLDALRRLFRMRSQLARMQKAFAKHEYLVGSQGQTIRNPMARELPTLRGEIRQLEDRFGFNPKGRLALGLQVQQVNRSIEDLRGPASGGRPVFEIVETGRGVATQFRKPCCERSRRFYDAVDGGRAHATVVLWLREQSAPSEPDWTNPTTRSVFRWAPSPLKRDVRGRSACDVKHVSNEPSEPVCPGRVWG